MSSLNRMKEKAQDSAATGTHRPVESGELIVAVDVGSSRVACAVAELTRRGPRPLAVESVASYGIRNGDVVDLKRASESIRIAIEAAAAKADAVVKTVVVGFSGDVRISTAKAALELQRENRAVTQSDVTRLKAFVSPEMPGGRRIIHRFDGPFSVGDLQGVEQPEGLSGERLEMHASFLSVAGDRLENVLRAVRNAGVDVEGVALEPLASSLGVLSKDERALGAVVLDFGAGAFRGALWEGGRLRQLCTLNAAANGGTAVLKPTASGHGMLATVSGMEGVVLAVARRFRIAPATAERLLRTHAVLGEEQLAEVPPAVEVAAVDGLGSVRIEALELSRTVEDLLTPAVRALREGLSGFSAGHTVGVVLTGGGAGLRGLAPWVGKRFNGAPVRAGAPNWLREPEDELANELPLEASGPRGCTLAGLLAWGGEGREALRVSRQHSVFGRLSDTLRRLAASF